MEDLSPNSFHEFALRVMKNESVAVEFMNWHSKGGRDSDVTSCDENCRRNLYCSMANSYPDDEDQCNKGQMSFKKRKDPHSFGFDKKQRMVMINED